MASLSRLWKNLEQIHWISECVAGENCPKLKMFKASFSNKIRNYNFTTWISLLFIVCYWRDHSRSIDERVRTTFIELKLVSLEWNDANGFSSSCMAWAPDFVCAWARISFLCVGAVQFVKYKDRRNALVRDAFNWFNKCIFNVIVGYRSMTLLINWLFS